MPHDHETSLELARLRAEFQAMNSNIARIATTVETALGDHETRLRGLERSQERASGVLRVVAWLGAPAAAGIVFFLAKSLG